MSRRAQASDCAAIARQREEPANAGRPAPRPRGDRTDVTRFTRVTAHRKRTPHGQCEHWDHSPEEAGPLGAPGGPAATFAPGRRSPEVRL